MNLIDRLDKYLLESELRERTSHHPSDVTACLRQLAYKWRNTEPSDPPTAGNIIKMKFGTLAEQILEEWLRAEVKAGTIEDYEEQVEIWGEDDELEYKIHGYIDFVVTERGEKYGIECKSSFGRGVKDIQLNGPKPEHVMQVYLYMRFTDINKFYLVYLGRDNGYRTQYELTWRDGELYLEGRKYDVDYDVILSRLKAAELAAGEEVLPEREYKAAIVAGEFKPKFVRNKIEYKADWQCNYCAYRSMCWGEQLKGGVWHGEDLIDG